MKSREASKYCLPYLQSQSVQYPLQLRRPIIHSHLVQRIHNLLVGQFNSQAAISSLFGELNISACVVCSTHFALIGTTEEKMLGEWALWKYYHGNGSLVAPAGVSLPSASFTPRYNLSRLTAVLKTRRTIQYVKPKFSHHHNTYYIMGK